MNRFKLNIKTCYRMVGTTLQAKPKPRFIDVTTNLVYGGDLPVPTPNQSVGSILYSRLMLLDRRDEIFQIDALTEIKMTTKMFVKNCVALAERLKEEGAKKGDYILLVGNNTLNMNVAMIGILFLGAVPVPLSHKTTLDEFKIILKTIKPSFFGCDKKYVYFFTKVLKDSSAFDPSKTFILNQEELVGKYEFESKLQSFPDFIQGRGKNFESFQPAKVDDSKAEIVLVMKALTEGAVGRLIGITHHNINSVIARYDAINDGVNLRNKVTLMVQKVLWMSGLYSLFFSCCYGSKLIVMRDFEEERFLKYISDYKVTTTYLFVSKFWKLYKHNPKRQYDVSSCKYIYVTDGSLPQVTLKEFKERFGLKILPSFGITELTGFVLKPFEDNPKEGSVGKLVPEVYAKVVSTSSGYKVGPNEVGELCFKGPIVTKGYINDAKSNHSLFDKEGFLMTGKSGYFDNDGDFFIMDYVKNLIRYKNKKIFPRELEDLLKTHDAALEACVIGIKHPLHGEYPLAFVEIRKGAEVSEYEIVKYVNDRVDDHKKLRGGVIFLEKIPRFRESGSVKRTLLKKLLSKYFIKLTPNGEDVKPKLSKEPTDIWKKKSRRKKR